MLLSVGLLRLILPALLLLEFVASVVSWEPPERLSDLASTLTVPPMPALVVSVVTLALSEMFISVPKSETLPPSPELLVWAVIIPAPEMVRSLLAVPILMSPPLPASPLP